ncbi:hypothetical protein HDU67_000707 [Dinochytrium kinnereticum]|nr:hypothetical protein HDU67_000707 [Dinochytrium kinnereticum]
MSFVRSILKVGESGIRASEIQARRFWQQESVVPVYARKRLDGVWFGITLTFLGVSMVNSGFQVANMIKGK